MLTRLMPMAVLNAADTFICLDRIMVSSMILVKIPQTMAIDRTIKGAVSGEYV